MSLPHRLTTGTASQPVAAARNQCGDGNRTDAGVWSTLGVVIATKDRPALLRQLLGGLATQTVAPACIVVVDASAVAADLSGMPGPRIPMTYLRYPPERASAAAQRNAGVARLAPTLELVALLDDDIALAPDALERMRAFWSSPAAVGVVGAGFNQIDAPAGRHRGGLQRSWLADWLGLYARRRGAVAASGWQSIIGTVERDLDTDWLPTGAAVWRVDVLQRLGGFDPFFTGYSYLEDLELSWRARRAGRLVVVAAAGFEHGYATAGKVGARHFGRVEVRNRLYFVRKHRFSVFRCLLGLLLRAAMTLAGAVVQRERALFARFLGNVDGALEQFANHGRADPGPGAAATHGRGTAGMTTATLARASKHRPRVLVCAFACNPDQGSEDAVGWNWLAAIAASCDVMVITAAFQRPAIESHVAASPTDDWSRRVLFIYPPPRAWHYAPTPSWRRIEDSILKPLMHLAYRTWQAEAGRIATAQIERGHFDLTHQLTYVGFRFPGRLWRLRLPFVWGPVGGLENTAWPLLGAMGWRGAVYFALRNIVNTAQRRLLSAPRRAARRAAVVIAATAGNQALIRSCFGVDSEVLCEVTAPPPVATIRRRTPDEPLRLVWSAAHVPGKGLPLLLQALAGLPANRVWALTILGDGPANAAWRRQALRLGLAPRCTWRGRLPRAAAIAALGEAHLFVITSLKDLTSTVLLEALSQGVPVLCPDHCGFRDVVTPDCGVRLPIDRPARFVAALGAALLRLGADEDQRRRLATGALARASQFDAAAKAEALRRLYRRILRGNRGQPAVHGGETG